MKALLIYPEIPDTFWSLKHAIRFIRKKAAFPPLGLLTVAAMLPEDWSLRLVDLNAGPLSPADLSWADCALLSAMVIQKDSARQVIERCRKAGLRVIAGGPLFTTEPEAFGEVDHLVLSEAELPLPAFLADRGRGCPGRTYPAEGFADVSETPPPRWDLMDLNRYAAMSIQFSRGCPFNCDFCNVTTLFGRRLRFKSAGQVTAELQGLYDLGWRGQVVFVDDNFIGNRAYLKRRLLPALREWRKGKRGLPFNTEVSIDLVDDPEPMEMMAAAGFDTVSIGTETPDETALAECNKKQNRHRDLVESIKRIQRAGLQVQGGFIVGFDSDTRSIFQRQIDFIQKSGIVTAMVGLLQAPAGSRLYQRLEREGRIRGALSGDNVDGTTNIVPKMEWSALLEGYRTILEQIYAPGAYYRRLKTFLREYRPPRFATPMDLQRFLAFFRSAFRLGILGRERFHYWGILFWTAFRRPRLLPLAVTLAIYGHHFRRVCQLHIL